MAVKVVIDLRQIFRKPEARALLKSATIHGLSERKLMNIYSRIYYSLKATGDKLIPSTNLADIRQ